VRVTDRAHAKKLLMMSATRPPMTTPIIHLSTALGADGTELRGELALQGVVEVLPGDKLLLGIGNHAPDRLGLLLRKAGGLGFSTSSSVSKVTVDMHSLQRR
jgi:hypothetical protein